MSFVGIAAKAGSTSARIAELIKQGAGSPGLASKIGTTSARITEFVDGTASARIAHALGTTTANAQKLRNSIGREGAIGLIIGLACGMSEE